MSRNIKVAQALVRLARELVAGKKVFNTQMNIGKAKYVVNFHDGEKTHKDGSPFYDIKTFKSKDDFEAYQAELKKKGYSEER